jgi:uncharacterized ferritin-like protein (DUF455 family)
MLMKPEPELRAAAREALACQNIEEKCHFVGVQYGFVAINSIAIDATNLWPEPPDLPGRPSRPALVAHTALKSHSLKTPRGLAALVHAVCHIEFNAINLALDAIWRFANMPRAYYTDWLRVAAEEAHHFTLLRAQLQSLGYDYGDFDAHDGLWAMTAKTAGDIVARMALVPRTLEARGLDATPPMQAKLRAVGTPEAQAVVDVLDIILRDEVGHVAIGNHWYRWLCAQHGLDPVAHYAQLTVDYQAPKLRAPLNFDARARAGFTEPELAWINMQTNPANTTSC